MSAHGPPHHELLHVFDESEPQLCYYSCKYSSCMSVFSYLWFCDWLNPQMQNLRVWRAYCERLEHQLILLFEEISWNQSPADAEGWLYCLMVWFSPRPTSGASQNGLYPHQNNCQDQQEVALGLVLLPLTMFSNQKHWVWMKLVYWLEYSSVYDLSAPIQIHRKLFIVHSTTCNHLHLPQILNLVNIDPTHLILLQ